MFFFFQAFGVFQHRRTWDVGRTIKEKSNRSTNYKQINTISVIFLIFLGSNRLIRNTSQYLYVISYSIHRPLLLRVLNRLPQNVMFQSIRMVLNHKVTVLLRDTFAIYIYGFLIPNQFHFIVLIWNILHFH